MNDESWDGGIGVLRAKVQGGAATWDVVQVESDELAVGCDEGLFEKIDIGRVANKRDFVPGALSDCGVGIFAWSQALAYDAAKVAGAPTSWNAPPGSRRHTCEPK